MKKNNNYVLWDLDGTIVLSEDKIFKGSMFRYASENIGLSFNLHPNDYIGKEAMSVFQKLLSGAETKKRIEYLDKYSYWYELAVKYILDNLSFIKERENVVEIWKELDDLGILNAVVTSSREDIAKAYLKKVGLLDLCKSLVCVNHVSKPKPSPEPYILCMKNLNTNKNNCVCIEDSVTGIKSGVSAGVKTIGWVSDFQNFKNIGAYVLTKKLDSKLIINALNY